MDGRLLEYFVAIADHRSFRRAADALYVSQPALSRAMNRLEAEVGGALFRRSRSGVVITGLGQALVPRARAIIADLEGLRSIARERGEEIGGQVRVALTPSPSIEPMTSIVAEAVRAHPGLRIVGVGFHSVREAADAVSAGSCEVAILGSERRPHLAHVAIELFYREEHAVAIPPGLALSREGALRPADLVGLPFIASPPATFTRAILDGFAGEHDIPVVTEAAHREALLPMVRRGIGLAFVSRTLARSADLLGIEIRSMDPPIEMPMWLVTRLDPTPAATAFVALARATVRDLGIRAAVPGLEA